MRQTLGPIVRVETDQTIQIVTMGKAAIDWPDEVCLLIRFSEIDGIPKCCGCIRTTVDDQLSGFWQPNWRLATYDNTQPILSEGPNRVCDLCAGREGRSKFAYI